jgi:hypothetical protein
VVSLFEILTEDELKTTLERVELVPNYMLKCEACTWGWSWFGWGIYVISRRKKRF